MGGPVARLTAHALRSICDMMITTYDKLAQLRLYGERLTDLFQPGRTARDEMSMNKSKMNNISGNRILDATRDAIEQGALTLDMVRRLADVSIGVISRKLQRACTAIAEHADIGQDDHDRDHPPPCLLELIAAAVQPRPRGGARERCTKMRPEDHARLVAIATGPETNTLTVRAMRAELHKTMAPGVSISTGHLSHLLLHRHRITVKKPMVYAREGINERNLPVRRAYIATHFRDANLDLVGVRNPYTACAAPRMAGQTTRDCDRSRDRDRSQDRDRDRGQNDHRRQQDENPSEHSDQRRWKAICDPRLYVFTDESGFNMRSTQRELARSHEGTPAMVNRRYVKGENHSLLIAIVRDPLARAGTAGGVDEAEHTGSQEQHEHQGHQEQRHVPFVFKPGGFKRKDFVAFIENELAQYVARYRRALPAHLCQERLKFVMDNASIHKGDVVDSALDRLGMDAVYLPPYAPTLNPCENVFHAVKHKLRTEFADRAIETARDLCSTVTAALAAVASHSTMIGAFFSHCGYRAS